MNPTSSTSQYKRKTLLRRRSIKARDHRAVQNQTNAFERGETISFYVREAAKRILAPTADDAGKVAE